MSTSLSVSKHAAVAAVGAVLSGVIFGVGLVVSGMARPTKVLGFLTVSKDWDPSLLLVMAGAIGVHAVAYRAVRRRAAPLAEKTFSVPPPRGVSGRVLAGAAIFGVGWGLSGFCPGPSVVALPSGALSTVLFVLAFFVGSFAAKRVSDS